MAVTKVTAEAGTQASLATSTAHNMIKHISSETSGARLNILEGGFREKLTHCLAYRPLSIESTVQDEALRNLTAERGEKQVRLMYKTLRRQKLEHLKVSKEQFCRGRPESQYRTCFNGWCTRCLWEDVTHVLHDKYLSNRKTRVEEYNTMFVKALMSHIYTDDLREKRLRYRAVESFLLSPPLRMFFWIWLERAAIRDFVHLTSLQISSMLENLQTTARRLVEHTFPGQPAEMWHDYFIYEAHQIKGKEWDCEDCIAEFLARVESWRRYQISKGFRPEWDFGSAQTIASIISSVFLHLHIMYKDGCFDAQLFCPSSKMDAVWDRWLTKYPPSSHADILFGLNEVAASGVLKQVQGFNDTQIKKAATAEVEISFESASEANFLMDQNDCKNGVENCTGWCVSQSSEGVFEGLGLSNAPWIYSIRSDP